MTAFFEEIGAVLGQASKKERYKELQKKWYKYSETMIMGSTALGQLKTITDLLGVPWAGLLLGSLKTGTDQAANVTKIGAAAAGAAAESSQTVEIMKKELKKDLENLNKPLIFFMDDIDRLDTAEIRCLFQLIKINADFPNLVFVVLCDRLKVEKALSEIASGTGREYLEKIVQVSFDLPQINKYQIEKVLVEGLNKILILKEDDYRFNRNRWDEMGLSDILPYFKNLRDVRRFLSSFSFIFGLYFREGTLEINQFDLIGIEVIRTFEPELYHQIPNYQRILAPSYTDYMKASVSGFDQNKIIAESLLKFTNKDRKDMTIKLLTKLFPAYGSAMEGSKIIPYSDDWKRYLRICEDNFFNRYFSLVVPESDIPQVVFDEIIKNAGDRLWLVEKLKSINSKGKLQEAYDRLNAHLSEINNKDIEPFITALMDIYEYSEIENKMFLIGADAYLLVNHLLDKFKSITERERYLLSAILNTNGYYMPIHIVRHEIDKRKRHKAHESLESLKNLDDMQLEEARQLCAKLIKDAICNGEIPIRRLHYILHTWKEIESPEKPKAYAKKLIHTLDGAIKYISNFISYRQIGKGEKKYFVRLEELSEFVELLELEKVMGPAIEGIQSVPSDELYQCSLKVFKDALNRHKEGKPDDPTIIEGWYDNN